MTNTVSGESFRQTVFLKWLRIDPLNRPRVYEQVYDTADLQACITGLGSCFHLESQRSAWFKTARRSSLAMLISPLMGPIMATGLGLAVGDFYLALKAIGNLVVSIAVAVGFSACIVWILPFHSETGEILARINPTLLDLGIARLSGLAGSVVVGRSGGGNGTTALPGVAIAWHSCLRSAPWGLAWGADGILASWAAPAYSS